VGCSVWGQLVVGVTSYFEFVTTLFGWIAYDAFWRVLADSGIVYIPFLIILFTNVVSSRRAGDDEGSAAVQSLKKSETDIVLAIAVLFLAAVPFSSVNLAEMQYVRPQLDCAVRDAIANGEPGVVNGANTNTSFDATLQTLSGREGRIPIWWGFVHVLTKSVISASIAGIPCTGDVAAVELRLENDHIDDPRLQKELNEFMMDCYMPSVSQFYRLDQGALSPAELDSIGYLGSDYFLNTGAYYPSFYSKKARANWAFDPVRDAGFEFEQADGGHPTCDQWWTSAANGLRTRLYGSINQDAREEYVSNPNALIRLFYPALNQAQREDVLLRKFLAIRNTQSNVSGFSNHAVSYEPGFGEVYQTNRQNGLDIFRSFDLATGDLVADMGTSAMAGLGTLIGAPGHLAAGVAAREGSTIFLSLILLVFVAVLPFLMVFSLYRLQKLMTFTIVFFGLHFFYVLWGLAFWIDNHIITALLDGGFEPIYNPIQQTIVLWSQRLLYLAFPIFWISAIAWTGVYVGGAITQGFSNLSTSPTGAMQSGGNMVGSAATSVATKGVGRGLKAVGK
jgi:hypothetical protein